MPARRSLAGESSSALRCASRDDASVESHGLEQSVRRYWFRVAAAAAPVRTPGARSPAEREANCVLPGSPISSVWQREPPVARQPEPLKMMVAVLS
jgi:hypothetical protein